MNKLYCFESNDPFALNGKTARLLAIINTDDKQEILSNIGLGYNRPMLIADLVGQDFDVKYITDMKLATDVLSFDELYEILGYNGYDLLEGIIEKPETIREYICTEAIPCGIACSKLLQSLENNPEAKCFIFDSNSTINVAAKPICTKDELIYAVLPEVAPLCKESKFRSDIECLNALSDELAKKNVCFTSEDLFNNLQYGGWQYIFSFMGRIDRNEENEDIFL